MNTEEAYYLAGLISERSGGVYEPVATLEEPWWGIVNTQTGEVFILVERGESVLCSWELPDRRLGASR